MSFANEISLISLLFLPRKNDFTWRAHGDLSLLLVRMQSVVSFKISKDISKCHNDLAEYQRLSQKSKISI